MLSKHLQEIEQAGNDEKRAAAHNIAARNAFVNLGIFISNLTEAAKTKTAGPRPSNRQPKDAFTAHAKQSSISKSRKELINATKPVRRSVSLKNEDITEITREMINAMLLSGADHTITLNPKHPIEAYSFTMTTTSTGRNRVTDEYPPGTSIETAEAHTITLLQTREEILD